MGASEILVNVLFYAFAVLTAGGAVLVASSRNIIRSAFSLLAVLFGAAALYALMKADFIAAAQVLIYVGGILVLIIFAVMLTHRITDVKISNESTPGPAAFCACLCLLFSLVVIILVAQDSWASNRDSEGVKSGEVTLLQYQADGQTGLARGGSAFETRAVVAVMMPKPPVGAAAVEVEAISERKDEDPESAEIDKDKAKGEKPKDQETAKEDKKKPQDRDEQDGKKKMKVVTKTVGGSRPVSPDGITKIELTDLLDGGEVRWKARFMGAEGPLTPWISAGDSKPDFIAYRGITEPAALALAGPYLFAFEVVSVLLLAALVGAAFLARKEVKE